LQVAEVDASATTKRAMFIFKMGYMMMKDVWWRSDFD
jgi:hypothetical protein